MKYASVKKFTLEEEDMNAIVRTRSILQHIHEKMDYNDSFSDKARRMIMTKDGVNSADGLLELFLTIVTDGNNSILIEHEQE
jgi:hypothetical protein